MKNYVRVTDTLFVSKELLYIRFSCDYEQCKGACCYASVEDAILDGGELTEDEYRNIREYFGDNVAHESESGYNTNLESCGTCKLAGTSGCVLKELPNLDIPVHCELYPIIAETQNGVIYLNMGTLFDKYCKTSYTKGIRDNISVIKFCKRPLTRLLGEETYNKLESLL